MLESGNYTDMTEENLSLLLMPKEIIQDYKSNHGRFKELESSMRLLHSGFIFYRNSTNSLGQICAEIFKVVVKRIGGTPAVSQMAGWKDLASNLGISMEDINYIDNSMRDSSTEMILKVFVQGKEATMDKLVSALIRIERYDVLYGIAQPLQNLYTMLFSQVSDDLGYSTSSWTDSEEHDVQILKPEFIPMDLPEVLRSPSSEGDFTNTDEISDEDYCEKFSDGSTKPFLLLTYSADGNSCARSVVNIIERNESLNVNVLTLERYKSKLYENPEHVISALYEKALYVIPILTPSYMIQIRSTAETVPSSLEDFDNAYVRFVYTLMTNQYICSTGCLNKKVRSILPTAVNRRILSELYKQPVLQVWTPETDLQKLLKMILK